MSHPQNNVFTQNDISISYPPGSILGYLGTADPDGWVIADGVLRPDNDIYSNLGNMGIGTRVRVADTFSMKMIFTAPAIAVTSVRLTTVLGNIDFYYNNVKITNIIDKIESIKSNVNPSSYFVGNTETFNSNQQTALPYLFSNTNNQAVKFIGVSELTISIQFKTTFYFDLISFKSGPVFRGNNNAIFTFTPTIISVYLSTLSTSYSTDSGWSRLDLKSGLYAYSEYGVFCEMSRSGGSYTPPNLSAAFLRGIGTNGVYGGATIKSFQPMGLLNHSHSATSTEHNHLSVNKANATGSDDTYALTKTSSGTSNITDNSTTEVNLVTNYTALNDTNTSSTAMSITINSMTGVDATYVANEVRPYNYGVNWIIKL